ncbi:MAG: amidohydrolase family protein [Actinomycetia bacterium]|nr:amidohydrolase family protein [Actinomycetes bacterium]
MVADTVLEGGTVIDGTGAPARRADVAITDGVITEIGSNLTGHRHLDASGQVVAPGFIDVHTHYDAQVFWDPHLTPSSHHGVTTVIAGNCGFSIAPNRAEQVDLLARTLHHVEDMSVDTLAAGVPWHEFETFPQYLDAVRRRGTTLNYGCYIGHTALRIWAMGDEAYEREPTEAELRAMTSAVAEALDAGAIGFATSHAPTHNGQGGRPVPSRRAPLGEVLALAAPLREADRGVVALLPGEGVTHDDVFTVWHEIRRPITWTALLTIKGFPWHEDVIATHDEKRLAGAQVWPQVSCRPLVFQMTMQDPFTFNMREEFRKLMDRPIDERIAAYRDPAWREVAWAELSGPGALPMNWDALSVAESDTHADLTGRGVADIAAERGGTMLDAMCDIALDDGLRTRFNSVLANNDPDAIAWLLPRDGVLLGLADSGAHVSQLCDACFATDLLGNWVREQDVMPLERAVHKLTGEPAEVFGLTGRGRLEVGAAADVAVFDPDTVAPGPLRRVTDFPADGERLTADDPVGMHHVLVGGISVREDGKDMFDQLEQLPGTVL